MKVQEFRSARFKAFWRCRNSDLHGLDQNAFAKATLATLPAETPKPVADSLAGDSLAADSLAAVSLAGDSLAGDSLAGDSLAGDSLAGDSLNFEAF